MLIAISVEYSLSKATLGPALHQLHRPLLGSFWFNGWKRAIHLQAAFDDRAEALALVSGLVQNFETQIQNADWADTLVEWTYSSDCAVRALGAGLGTHLQFKR